MSFKPVSSQVDLATLEDQINKFWKENKIFEKSVEQRPSDNLYTFVDGPPFVSGSPHYGHLLTSIAKDLIPRYQAMRGKRVRRVFGWDCHGLPIEDKVNKLFSIKSSAQLEEKLGVDRYVKECRKYVENTTSDWRWYIEKIGRWVDMDNAYYTMNIDFMESVIWGFKQIYEKGLIYKGRRVSLYSTDTSTPVSNFEVAMDPDNYQDVDDLSVFVKFEVENRPEFLDNEFTQNKKIYLTAWTTTPWTIPANFALAVNKNFTYSLVQFNNELFIVAKDRIIYTFSVKEDEIGNTPDHLVNIIAEFHGEKLEGLKYLQVYNYLKEENENNFKVYLSEDVTIDEGTGVLHIAPAFGEVDFLLGKKYNLSAISDIDSEGKMIIGPWQGIYLRDASALIAEDMQTNGYLLRSEIYKHRLPFYRGQQPLIYMAQDAYFVDVQKIKDRMSELNQEINWIPKHIKDGRFGQTIATSPDWCISRNRYWATIMPIWKNEDGDEIVIGSLEELTTYSDKITKKEENGKIKYFFKDQPMDLHRDMCDKIILKKDGKEYKRIPEVLDCWMDSGSVPFAEYHYPFENKEAFEKSKPADFIIEYTPQVRAWFNVLLRISTIIFDENAFLNAICHGTIAGTDGRKMSKSFGNYPDPKVTIEKYGADALRLYFMSSPVMVGEDMNFNEENVAENYRFLLTFWNTYKFFVDYANVFEWSCDIHGNVQKEKLNVLDKWILAKLTEHVLNVRTSLDKYDVPSAVKLVKDFLVNDFSTWYIRRSRDRVSNNENPDDRNTCLSVMYGVLVTFCKVSAPIIPFITENIYKNLTNDLSVHLTDFPKGDENLLNTQLVKSMEIVRSLVELGHSIRKEFGIKLRQPLQSFTYKSGQQLDVDLEKIIGDELNVKQVKYVFNNEMTGDLDINITQGLKDEGEARELIRRVQQMRKEMGLTLKDKVKITVTALPKVTFIETIKRQTNADDVVIGETESVEVVK